MQFLQTEKRRLERNYESCIDGITDAVSAIENGGMIASDFQNAEGQITGAIEAAVKVLNGETVEKEIWIPFEMITPENVEDYKGKY